MEGMCLCRGVGSRVGGWAVGRCEGGDDGIGQWDWRVRDLVLCAVRSKVRWSIGASEHHSNNEDKVYAGE